MDIQVERLKAALADRYDISRELGAGGMATVYLAEDLKHHRNVAVKVLRPELAAIIGGERFLQEIEVTANLQHPNILPLYDSGEADTFLYYVMPFIEGESLRDLLNREKQLSIDETIEIGRSVCAALQYAHERNIVHRDIKPENILLQSGQALVADFGIALAVSEAGGTRLTETGLSLGTPYYMSPEQASGDRELDGRSDLYALAATLYESFAGEPPFTAPSAQAIVAKILTEKAPLATEVRETVPLHVAIAIQKALEKLPADRFHSAAEFAEALTNPRIVSTVSPTGLAHGVPGKHRVSRWRTALPWAVSFLAAAIAGVAVLGRNTTSADALDPVEFTVRLEHRLNQKFALSNDGRLMAMSSATGGLWMRSMGSTGVSSFPGSEEHVWAQPAFSPDGEWVVFVDIEERELRRVSVAGGVPVPIVSIPLLLFGLSWGPQNTIVYGGGFSGLWSVPVDGGVATQLTVPDTSIGELGHWYPQILPGGSKVLFSTYRAPVDSAAVEIFDLDTGQRTVLFRGGMHAQYVATEHIVYSRGETLWAIPFDLDGSRVTGSGVPVREGVSYDPTNALGGFAISDNGTLAYIDASVWNAEGELVWVDRNGSEQPLQQEPGVYADPAISPDGERLAVIRTVGGVPDVWVNDLTRGEPPTRVTRNAGLVARPLWTPDGSDVIYSRERWHLELMRRDWQASTPEEPILRNGSLSGNDLYAYSVAPDGRLLVAIQSGSWDVLTVPLSGGDPMDYRVTEYHETGPALSPDGRWVAYASNESGPLDVWIDPYPGDATGRGRHRISRGGGSSPRWGRDGELFYRDGEKMMAVRVDLAAGTSGTPVELFARRYAPGPNYDVDNVGQRFLMIKPSEDIASRQEVTVVLNWFDELLSKMGGN